MSTMGNSAKGRSCLIVAVMVMAAIPGVGAQAPDILEVLKEEILDSISLEQTAVFLSPDGGNIEAMAGSYHVETVDGTNLRLISTEGAAAFVIQAYPTKHLDRLAMPVALSVSMPGNTLHVVLLLPGGKGLETIGSYAGSHTRELQPRLLSPLQLHEALERKLRGRPSPQKGN